MSETVQTPKQEELRDNALVTWEMVKKSLEASPSIPRELDLENVDVKNYLIMITNSVSSQVEGLIGKSLGKKEYRERLATGTSVAINLKNSPIRTLKEVTLVREDGTKQSHPLDSDLIRDLNEESDFRIGTIYLDTLYLPPQFKVGLGGYGVASKRNLLITYDAGYILPTQETEDEPSDLPHSIIGIVLDVIRREFERKIDPQRSGDLIQLQEGNVNRMWGTGVMTDLAKKGYFTKAEQEILKTFSSKRALYTA